MQSGYIIEAYSPSLNEAHRRLDLADLTLPTDPISAQRDADAFAYLFNRDQKNHATDWVGRIVWQDVGIETLPGFLFAR
jgi:hypothetical protein